ncbi:GPW/gp25 family protein [Microbacterium cremeum]|uniref:GPW/gp25 family protein n=1 Tax=Microbacterium cremeum TaxID=2782169 RepID=UPI0018873BD2|nr:GPW/gp25 family protein [Microbacterium cremeum]
MTPQAPTRRTPPVSTGWRFGHPDFDDGLSGVTIAPTGRVDLVHGADAVRQSLMLLLSTTPGERVMRPDYGCDLAKLVFSPGDDTTAGLAIHYVRRAVQRFEPRVVVLAVDAGPAPDAPDRLEVVLDYRPRLGGPADRLVAAIPLQGGA